jgi:hypothetical protein
MSSVLIEVLLYGHNCYLRWKFFGDEVILVVERVVGATTEKSELALDQAEGLFILCLLLKSSDCLRQHIELLFLYYN